MSGIGMFLGIPPGITTLQAPWFVVKSVKDGGAAALDGRVKSGDLLVEIDGKRLAGLNLEEATSLVLGNPNSR